MTRLTNPDGPVNIRIKVQGGTLPDKFLCESCQFGTVMRGATMKQVQVRCSGLDPVVTVPFRVVQCNRYSESDSTDLRQMRQDAYYIHKTSPGGCHVLTRAQYEDFALLDRLALADARKLLPRRKRKVKTANAPQLMSLDSG